MSSSAEQQTFSRKVLSLEEALTQLSQELTTGPVEEIPLDQAYQRILAEDLVADHPVPLFDRSSYDGYAIRAEDTWDIQLEAPLHLQVIQAIGAGDVADKEVISGTAIRIMTGAALPTGANAVIMLEETQLLEKDNVQWIQISRRVEIDELIAKRGEDTLEGELLVPQGKKIVAGEMALLATFGYAKVKVYQQPVVGIFTTGSELLPVEAEMRPGKIRNSNAYMLMAQVEQLGAIPRYYGILEDNLETCYQAVEKALQEVDFLITTGGASIGDYDFIQAIVHKLDAQVLFNKISMRPGSVTTVAKVGEKWLFGLSGNPAACFVGFELFSRPVLAAYQGWTKKSLQNGQAYLKTAVSKKDSYTRLLRAHLMEEEGRLLVSPVGIDQSRIVSALALTNALIVMPAEVSRLEAGTLADVLFLSS